MFFVLACLLMAPAMADYVRLKSGAVYYGKVEEKADGVVLLTVPNGSRLTLRPAAYEKVFNAEKVFDTKLEALAGQSPVPYLELGKACAKVTGAEDLAFRLFQLATDLDARAPATAAITASEAQYQYARLMLKLVRDDDPKCLEPLSIEDAEDHLRRALHFSPAHEQAHRLLRQLKKLPRTSVVRLRDALGTYLAGDYDGTCKHIERVTTERAQQIFKAGTGVDWADWIKSVQGQKLCMRCKGGGKIVCPKCRGRGSFACTLCKGTGMIRRRLGKQACYRCNGTGKIQCETCGGSGKATCPSCKGSGFLKVDAYRQRAEFMRACRRLHDALGTWDGREALFSPDTLLPTHPLDNERMVLLGTARQNPGATVAPKSAFYRGQWLTPAEKQARMDPN